MPLIGPFFYINKKLIYNACALENGREQAGKLDNSYGHDKLYDANFRTGDYINYPRGRVIWDKATSMSVIYIDRCIDRPDVIGEIIKAFNTEEYTVEYDDHYRCRRCVGDLFD